VVQACVAPWARGSRSGGERFPSDSAKRDNRVEAGIESGGSDVALVLTEVGSPAPSSWPTDPALVTSLYGTERDPNRIL
jgi:hypothetical protein